MTADSGSARHPVGRPYEDAVTSQLFLRRFRSEVDILASELAQCPAAQAVEVLRQGLTQDGIRRVLNVAHGTTMKHEAFFDDLTRTVEEFAPTEVSSARSIPGLVKVRLLASLDTAWWGSTQPFVTDDEIIRDASLMDLRKARSRGSLDFVFRTQAFNPVHRAVRAADRRLWPDRTPRTIGMRLPYTRIEMVAVLNSIAAEFALREPRAPRLWVNSAVRSVAYQKEMRRSGYTAADGSAHCVGWAADIEMAWMTRNGSGEALADVLRSRADLAQLNVIDEGQAWHICLNPAAVGRSVGDATCAE